MNFSDVDDVSFEGRLVPEGRVELCIVLFDKEKRTTEKGNGYYGVTMEVIKGPYAGSKFFENICVDGPEGYFLQRGKAIIRYLLETTKDAHNNPSAYEVRSIQDLNGHKIVVKFGIKVHTNKKGESMLVNEAKAYGTPRPDSSNHKYFTAWESGEQPWETDARPALPNGSSYKPAMPAPAFDDEIPF